MQKSHPQAAEYLYRFIESTQRRELSLRSLLEQALNFPHVLSELSGKPILLMIDEFQEISLLENFRQLPDVLGLVRDVLQTHQRILYVLSGSYVRLLQDILENPESPFFGQINPHCLNPFGKEDSLRLLSRLSRHLDLELATGVKKKMVDLTSGHPSYIELLANSVHETRRVDSMQLTEENVQKILLLQLLNEKSILSFHLCYVYEDALGRARGRTILHGILKVLAKDAPLTTTQIANRMSKKVGLIQLGLGELLKWMS